MTPAAPSAASRRPLYKSLFAQVVAGLVLGVALGMAAPDFAIGLKFFSDAFLKLISMIVAPIVFCVVVHGIAGAGDLEEGRPRRRQGAPLFRGHDHRRAGRRTAPRLSLPTGRGDEHRCREARRACPERLCRQRPQAAWRRCRRLHPQHHPDHFVRRARAQRRASGAVLRHRLWRQPGARRRARQAGRGPDRDGVEGAVPRHGADRPARALGRSGAVAYTVGEYGVGSLEQLASLVVVFWSAVALFVLVVLGAVMRVSTGLSILQFLNYFREELTIVLATASSDAVLPQIMRKLERMGVDPSVVGLVVPTGYSFNLDAFSIYLTLATVFIAQATNTPLSFGDLLLILGHFAHHLEGRARRARLRDRHPRRHLERGPGDPGDRARPRAVDRLVRRHGPGARQSDRQLRGDRRDRGVGERSGPRPRQGGSIGPGRRGSDHDTEVVMAPAA